MTRTVPYFEPASRLQLSEKMRHLLHFSDLVILLIGNESSGRSRLMAEIDPGLEQGEIRGTSLLLEGPTDVSHLLSGLVSVLRLDCPADADNRQRLRALNRFSRDLHELGVHLVLLIDDAGYLSDNALELLTNFATLDEASPSLLMSGDQAFEERFKARVNEHSLEGRVHTEHLEPFTPDETTEFINTILPEGMTLDSKQRTQVAELSEGLPGRVISQLELALKEVPAEKLPKRSKNASNFPIPSWAMLGVTIVLVAILGMSIWFFMPKSDSRNTVADQQIELKIPTSTVAVDNSPVVEADNQKISTTTTHPVLEQRLAEQEAQQQVSNSPDSDAVVADTSTTQSAAVPSIDSQSKIESVTQTASIDQNGSTNKDSISSENSSDKLSNKVTTGSVSASKSSVTEEQANVLTTSVQKKTSAKTEAEGSEAKTVEKTAAASAIKSKTSESVTSAAAQPKNISPKVPAVKQSTSHKSANSASPSRSETKVTDNLFRDSELLAWPDRGYTLQFLAAREVSSVKSFFNQVSERDRFYAYDSVYKGKPWFVIIYGQFVNRDAAMAAARKLPASLRKFKPWARSIASVKADIQKKK